MRGPSAVDRFTYIEGAEIVAICDLYQEKLAPVQNLLERRGKTRAAEWSCISELSRVSIENGSMPVVMPDFTRGDWKKTDGLRLALKKQ